MKFISLLIGNKLKKVKMSIILFNIFFFIFIVLIISNSRLIQSSIKGSISLFMSVIIPALLPFLLITELLISSDKVLNLSYGFGRIIAKVFRISRISSACVVIGFLLGYPNGAKYITKLYLSGKISSTEAKKLVAFTSNANIGFVVSAVGIGMFGNFHSGIILLISHFLSAIIMGIIYNPKPNTNIIQQSLVKSNSFSEKKVRGFDVLLLSMRNVCVTLSYIFFFMIIFTVIPEIINSVFNLNNNVYNFLLGFLEITSGIYNITRSDLSYETMMILVSFILSFSSIMILMQVFSFVYKCKIKFKELLLYKLIQGILSMITTYILLRVVSPEVLHVFSNIQPAEIIFSNSNMFITIYFLIAASIIFFLLIKGKRLVKTNRSKGG